MTSTIIDLVQILCTAVKEVQIMVNQMPYSTMFLDQDGTYEAQLVETLSMTTPVKIQ